MQLIHMAKFLLRLLTGTRTIVIVMSIYLLLTNGLLLSDRNIF